MFGTLGYAGETRLLPADHVLPDEMLRVAACARSFRRASQATRRVSLAGVVMHGFEYSTRGIAQCSGSVGKMHALLLPGRTARRERKQQGLRAVLLAVEPLANGGVQRLELAVCLVFFLLCRVELEVACRIAVPAAHERHAP